MPDMEKLELFFFETAKKSFHSQTKNLPPILIISWINIVIHPGFKIIYGTFGFV